MENDFPVPSAEVKEVPGEAFELLPPERKRRLYRHIARVAAALCEARAKKPRTDHFTVAMLQKLGAPKGNVIRRVCQDHRLALWRALAAECEARKLPRWKRIPFYESGCVWP